MSSTVNAYMGNIHSEGYLSLHKQDEIPSTETDHGQIYAQEDTGTTRLFAMDGDGNSTQISPHNENGEWVFFSKNIKTGRVVRINMEKMIKRIEELTGDSFIEEWFE